MDDGCPLLLGPLWTMGGAPLLRPVDHTVQEEAVLSASFMDGKNRCYEPLSFTAVIPVFCRNRVILHFGSNRLYFLHLKQLIRKH